MAQVVTCERRHSEWWTYRELLTNSADRLCSLKCFSTFNLTVLVLWPSTLLFWLTLTAQCGFQTQQSAVFVVVCFVVLLHFLSNTKPQTDNVSDSLVNAVQPEAPRRRGNPNSAYSAIYIPAIGFMLLGYTGPCWWCLVVTRYFDYLAEKFRAKICLDQLCKALCKDLEICAVMCNTLQI